MSIFALDKPYATKVVSASNILSLTNTKLVAGRTYYIKVAFRTRGDGDSTSSKCSSVGFIAYWDSWKQVRSYIHNSAQAYAERGALVSWTYSFTVSSDVQPTGTALYFIINNGWANGYDNQTIDLYYAKYWDSAGNVYNEWGEEAATINIMQQGTIYPAPFASTTKHATPSLAFRKDGKTWYVPLAPLPLTIISTALDIIVNGYRYQCFFSYYSSPNVSIRYNGNTYKLPNKTYIEKQQYDIPAGTYSPQSFNSLISNFISANGSRRCSNEFTVQVNNQKITVAANTPIYYTKMSSGGGLYIVGFGISQHPSEFDFSTQKQYVTLYNSPGYPFKEYANYMISIGTGIKFV